MQARVWHPGIRSAGPLLALALLPALCPAPLYAEPAPAERELVAHVAFPAGKVAHADEPEAPPLDPLQLRRSPELAAVRVFGSSALPQVGAVSTLAGLYLGEDKELEYWSLQGPFSIRAGRRQIGAASLFLGGFHGGAGMPTLTVTLPELANLLAGDDLRCWTLMNTDVVRPIPDTVLESIEDSKDIAVGSLEADAYANVLILANYTSNKAFLRAAEKDISYGSLLRHPGDYRGKVVYVEGLLRQVSREKKPMFEAGAEGVSDLYVAFIFPDRLNPNPYRVVFTEWPAGLPRDILGKDHVEGVVRVSFAGYFYKRFRYKARDSSATTAREVPMLIGHTLTVVSLPASPHSAQWVGGLGWWVGGLIFGGLGLVLVFAWWYRRNDQAVRLRVLAVKHDEFALPPPDAAPVAQPVRPPHRPFPARNNLPPGFGSRGVGGDTSHGSSGKEEAGPPGPDEGAGV